MPCWLLHARSDFLAWLISVGDAFSQFLGRLIVVYYDDELQTFTRYANESISGAADWHLENGRFTWVAPAIDLAALIVSLGRDKDHCRTARLNDKARAEAIINGDW